MKPAYMIPKILVVAAGFFIAILIFAATKPATFRIERSILIDSPAERVFALVSDFHNWNQWAPDEKGIASFTRTYSGAAGGEGAVSEWQGSGKAGQGRMSIIESTPPRKIIVQVDWRKPFEARNVNEFTFEQLQSSTNVTWQMRGPNLYIMKVMSIFVNMDRQMGEHFDAGLASLKAAAEK
jgi:uncharacterized protein YndB with AHSA1/START domain